MKKALITGITGQDGSYLAEFLLEKGYEVHGITRRASISNTARIDHLIAKNAITLHDGDLSDSSSLIRIISIVQPDVGWAGGITECRKIGAMAQAMSKPISLHCFGSAVLFAASLHLAAALPNTEMMESEENPNPLKTDIMKGSFETDSQMSFFVPEGDGLGVDLDWLKMEKYVIK
mgnify:CR=1 FL=1